MLRALRYVVPAILGLALGLFVGFPLGMRQGFIGGLRHLENHTVETLTIDVEVASFVRLGENGRALSLLDKSLDGHVLQLVAAQQNLGVLAAAADWNRDDALASAKLYRGIVPPSEQDASAIEAALAGIPALNKRPPSPGLAQLAARAGKQWLPNNALNLTKRDGLLQKEGFIERASQVSAVLGRRLGA